MNSGIQGTFYGAKIMKEALTEHVFLEIFHIFSFFSYLKPLVGLWGKHHWSSWVLT